MIIPLSKWLVTPTSKPFRPIGRGITLCTLGTCSLLTVVKVKNLLTRIILQAHVTSFAKTHRKWCGSFPNRLSLHVSCSNTRRCLELRGGGRKQNNTRFRVGVKDFLWHSNKKTHKKRWIAQKESTERWRFGVLFWCFFQKNTPGSWNVDIYIYLYLNIHIYIYIFIFIHKYILYYIHTLTQNDPYFGRLAHKMEGWPVNLSTPPKRAQCDSRCIYIYICMYTNGQFTIFLFGSTKRSGNMTWVSWCQWFCPRNVGRCPKPPQRKKFLHKLLVKHSGVSSRDMWVGS